MLNTKFFSKHIKVAFIGLSSAAIAACGGGGDQTAATDSANIQEATYEPNSQRLQESAETSKDLYVESDFDFKQLDKTELSIDLIDQTGEGLAFTRINIYWVNTDLFTGVPQEWNDEDLHKAHLLSGGISDAEGSFKRIIEFPSVKNSYPLMLVEVNAIGFENKVLVPIKVERAYISINAS